MFKKLGMIGLAVAITLAVVSSTMADLKFYGGQMTANISIAPTQNLVIGATAVGTQTLTGGNMNIATDTMYAVVADNEFLTRAVSGAIGKAVSQRQVTASADVADGYFYKSSGLQTTVGSFGVTSADNVILNGNNGNIQFDARGADPRLTLNSITQDNTDAAPAAGPSMTQTNNETAVLLSPGQSADLPMSMITTGDATGLITIGSSIGTATQQDQEFSSLLSGCAGLYNGQMQKIDTMNFSGTHQMGTGSILSVQ